MTMQLLAEVTAGGISPETVGVIIASVIVALISGGVLGKKVSDSSKTTIDPQPLKVEMAKDFITRDEHAVYRAEVRSDIKLLEAKYDQMTLRVETKHLELLATIERAAKTGVDGRVAIWEDLKPLSREVAALKATSNVAEQLGKLADTLKQNQRNGKTTDN
jgi:hypothetical protein